MNYLNKTDKEISSLIKKEEKRQQNTLMMIPSENIVSRAVSLAVGSVLGNKYAEGYSKKRYYQGQEFIDQIEELVIKRAKKLFNVPYVNVQPHSGSPANLAVYVSLLEEKDKLLGLALEFGGHLTHGAPVSVTGRFFNSIQYGLNKSGYIDYDEIQRIAKKEKPKIIVAGTTAYPRIINWKLFAKIADSINAYLLADISHLSGLIISNVYPTPVPYAHIITTTTHKTLRGPRGAMIMLTKKGIKKDQDLPKKIDKSIIPGLQGGPHINAIAGIGVALKEASTKRFKAYSKQIILNAKILEKELIKYNFNLVSGGTDSHLLLIDLKNKNILGNTAAEACEKAAVVLNRNAVPHDTNPRFYPSGIRLGTPGITSRGMKKQEMIQIAKYLNQIIQGLAKSKEKMKIASIEERKKSIRTKIINNTPDIKIVLKKVKALCKRFQVKKMY